MLASRDNIMNLSVDEIIIEDGRRSVDRDAVKRISASIEQIGLQHPITVRSRGDRFVLVAGRHRLEAVRSVGEEYIRAAVVRCDDTDARLWEIAENLHRSELSVQERSDQIAEWVDLVSVKLTETKREGRPGAVTAASKELGLDRNEVRRANKIAGITEEAKQAAQSAGLSDNQAALLEIAKAPIEQQVEVVHHIADRKARKPVPPSDPPRNEYEVVNIEHRALVAAWEKARPEARHRFLSDIGAVLDDPAVMDRMFA